VSLSPSSISWYPKGR